MLWGCAGPQTECVVIHIELCCASSEVRASTTVLLGMCVILFLCPASVVHIKWSARLSFVMR